MKNLKGVRRVKEPQKSEIFPTTNDYQIGVHRSKGNEMYPEPWIRNRDWILWLFLVVMTFAAYHPAWMESRFWMMRGT